MFSCALGPSGAGATLANWGPVLVANRGLRGDEGWAQGFVARQGLYVS